MATKVRSNLSKKNKYYIGKHRYYELKHFCLQYPYWKQSYSELDGLKSSTIEQIAYSSNGLNDPTYNMAEERVILSDKMKMIEQTAIAADPDIYRYILKAVTEGASFTYLKSKMHIPCGRDMYYDRYRRFFWLLDKTKM